MSDVLQKDKEVESIIEKMIDFEPLITMEDIDKVEPLERERSRNRRIMLATLTKNSEELFKFAEESPELVEDIFHMVNGYITTLRSLTEMAEACSTRLFASLSFIEYDKLKILFDELGETINVDKKH